MIGKYSSLACSNTVYITSYYEGKAYYYVMVKSGNSITTNLLIEKPTTEKNGVEVSIKNIKNIDQYKEALKYIVFFPNIYIDGVSNANVINNTTLKRFKNFVAADTKDAYSIKSKLLLGNVLYKCDNWHLKQEVRDFLNKIIDTNIVISFNVGEINITPNRESIIYNTETIKKIEDRVLAAKEEIEDIIRSKIIMDYDDIIDYYKNTSFIKSYNFVTDEIINSDSFSYYSFFPSNIAGNLITFKGQDISSEASNLCHILNLTIPNYKGVVNSGNICIKRMSYNLTLNKKLLSNKILILNKGAKFVKAAQSYVKEHYSGYSIMSFISKEDFVKWINNQPIVQLDKKKHDFIIDNVYISLIKRAAKLDLETNNDYLKYKKDFLESNKVEITKQQEIILYEQVTYTYRQTKYFNRFETVIKYLKGHKKGIILAPVKADTDTLYSLSLLKGFVLIKAKQSVVDALRKLNLSCLIDIDWLIKKDPMLTVVNTLIKYFPDVGITDLSDLQPIIDKNLYKEFENLYRTHVTFSKNTYYRHIINNGDFGIDSYTKELCKKLDYYHKKILIAKELIIESGHKLDAKMLATVILKSKSFRISGEIYNHIKNDKLIKLLCKKS